MIENNFILLLFAFALVIFSINAIFRKNIRSFQITIVLFILLMFFGEIVIIFTDTTTTTNDDSNIKDAMMESKVQIQFVAMVFLLIVVWFRYYRILRSKRKPVETMDSILK